MPSKEHLLSIAGRISVDFLLYSFSDLKILGDLRIHLDFHGVCVILEEFRNLHCIFCCDYISFLGCAQNSFLFLLNLKVSIGHRLIEVEGLSEVLAEEFEADLVLSLRVRSLDSGLELPFLIFNHLFAPLGLHDRFIRQTFEISLAISITCICHLLEGLRGDIVVVLVCGLPLVLRLELLSKRQLVG